MDRRAQARQLDGLTSVKRANGRGAGRIRHAVGPGRSIRQMLQCLAGHRMGIGQFSEVAAEAVEQPLE